MKRYDLNEGVGYPSLPAEDPARSGIYHLFRQKVFRDSGVPKLEMQGPNPARRGHGVSGGGPQKEDTGGDSSFAPRQGLPRGRGPAGSRRGAGARGVRTPALPHRGRFDRHPDRARPERVEDLQLGQPLALAGSGKATNKRAPLSRSRRRSPLVWSRGPSIGHSYQPSWTQMKRGA